MAGRKNGLGRGLDAFFPDRTSVVKEPARKTITKTVKTEKKSDVAEKQTNPTVAKKQTADSKTGAMIVKISSVEPNMDQPRKQFDEDALMELSESIKQYGVLHPLLVSDKKDYYEIIAGERRWRAAKLAGLTEIPVIVKEFSEQELVEISLIENIQREDLNPVEEAMAYKRLIDEFHLKQDEIAERVGKSRTAVTNSMRLLKLNEKGQCNVLCIQGCRMALVYLLYLYSCRLKCGIPYRNYDTGSYARFLLINVVPSASYPVNIKACTAAFLRIFSCCLKCQFHKDSRTNWQHRL